LLLQHVLQANGSLLLATTSDEVQQLEARAAMLQQQGVPGVLLLSPRELKMAEPALKLPAGSHGLLVKSDAQIVSRALAAGAAAQIRCMQLLLMCWQRHEAYTNALAQITA
jgi:L-2-hydroxyglutarate oxidase LhgO